MRAVALPQDLSFSRALNSSSLSYPKSKSKWRCHLQKPTLNPLLPPKPFNHTLLSLHSSSQNPQPHYSYTNKKTRLLPSPPSAGRSKKTPSTGRIEGSSELRRQARRNAKRKTRKLYESFFYRLKNPHKYHADNFSEDELEMIGLGYDRMVRFMSKDDPNLRHPYDWYKYGEYGPYSWRGIVIGDPIRGRFSDERVSIIGQVKSHEEWEKIEQHEMAVDFGDRLKAMNKDVGCQHFWIFVRHPRWKVSDAPWEQWTLVSEVVLEAGKQRLDKWSLMGRLGNKARSLITQCAAWMRPDIIYVKRPVYQCRFEPQVQFFQSLLPLLDPETEQNYLFELVDDEGRVELCTYFAGLCKIVRVNQKAFVDDVVKGYEKLTDENKSKCLEFLLMNHPSPVPLLHPYTKEWKVKLDEMDLGCDAPDEDDDNGIPGVHITDSGEKEFLDWVEDGETPDNEEDDDGDDEVLDVDGTGDDESGIEEEDESSPEEDEKYWDEEFKNAISSNEAMEKLVKRSVKTSTQFYEKQLKAMEEAGSSTPHNTQQGADTRHAAAIDGDGDETAMRGKRAKVSPEEWRTAGFGPWRKRIKKSRIPPELFLRAAVRPFTYRNLVKEIVLTRHAILDGEIGQEKK